MQRQLLQIADKIPDDITLVLLKSFAQILSREPEPAPKSPFIRAFAKIRDDLITRNQFTAIAEESEEQLNGNSENENECTFNYKVTTSTEEVVYSVGNTDEAKEEQSVAIEDVSDENILEFDEIEIENAEIENDENLENSDEGIEMEMPKLLPADEITNEEEVVNIFEQDISVEDEHPDPEFAIKKTTIDEVINSLEIASDEFSEQSEEEKIPVADVTIPAEPPKVSLDDIEREIEEMQKFLMCKGIGPNKKNRSDAVPEQRTENIEDAYKMDVCLKLKNKKTDGFLKDHSQKKHHHSKYMRSENYKEEILKDGPIFDPTIPNTVEDFMKEKSVSEKIYRKKQKVQALDVSWQKLCENQKKLYKLKI